MRQFQLLFVACIFAAVTLLGCGKNEDAPTYKELKGRVAAVDQANGTVEMYWYSTSKKKEIRLPGKLAPDAEIMINGATARLEDIQVDDKVTVIGRDEKHDGKRDLVATKVEVTRMEPAETPASKPAK